MGWWVRKILAKDFWSLGVTPPQSLEQTAQAVRLQLQEHWEGTPVKGVSYGELVRKGWGETADAI